jgi:Ni2+-binding GTPase involved in maturation of urease and hydrogenase
LRAIRFLRPIFRRPRCFFRIDPFSSAPRRNSGSALKQMVAQNLNQLLASAPAIWRRDYTEAIRSIASSQCLIHSHEDGTPHLIRRLIAAAVRHTLQGRAMKKARYLMIGGFLGSGKTTAILGLARRLAGEGRSVGLITNDQSIDLVDTARARAAGHPVEEITGGCFCCRFDSLVEASQKLTRENAPEVLIAEPVGSCTDLKATVSYPLRQIYGDRYEVSPLSVLVDPHRCAAILGLTRGKSFSPRVSYVYRKQLEEAEVIVIHKADLLRVDERRELAAALAREFPAAETLVASTRSGEGLDAWHDRLLSGVLGRAEAISVDYDQYAEGEALLGWFNGRGRVTGDGEFDGNGFLIDLARRINERLSGRDVQIAHLKMTLSPEEGPDLASVSLTRNEESPHATHELRDPLRAGELMVNLRAEADPELLKAEVLEELRALPGKRFDLVHLAAFRPARPSPTHRLPGP